MAPVASSYGEGKVFRVHENVVADKDADCYMT